MSLKHRYQHRLSKDADFQIILRDQTTRLAKIIGERPKRSMIYLSAMIVMRDLDPDIIAEHGASPAATPDKPGSDTLGYYTSATFNVPELALLKATDSMLMLEKKFISRSPRTLVHLCPLVLQSVDDETIKQAHDNALAVLDMYSHSDYVVQALELGA